MKNAFPPGSGDSPCASRAPTSMGWFTRKRISAAGQWRQQCQLVAGCQLCVQPRLTQVNRAEWLQWEPLAAGERAQSFDRIPDRGPAVQRHLEDVEAQRLGIAREEQYPHGDWGYHG